MNVHFALESTLEPAILTDTEVFTAGSIKAIKAFKSVKFTYSPTSMTREVLEAFRGMVNDAIRICIDEGINGRLKLRDRIYREFQLR
ncbi:MAG: hypothetical protein OK452_09330, partial [Thaumarchaeota archaeon]|nr:hypothetical protein [Nitrososphaerota archaeon]